MLKISFTITSNIRYNTSNARLFRLFNELYSRYEFFKPVLGARRCKILKRSVSTRLRYKYHTTMIIRSPFHYKTSKTLLSQPRQDFTLSLWVESKEVPVYFINNDFLQYIKRFKSINAWVLKKVTVAHLQSC